jgi:transcriptional regulator with XRE-family HTH domain
MNSPTALADKVTRESAASSFGARLRAWRLRRHLSQLALANDIEISTRHLSYMETGRANPSRDMLLRLTARLEVPLRERNVFLLAAGYAPMYREVPLDDPALAGAKKAVELILKCHEPFPALAIDRHWNLVTANRMAAQFFTGVDEALLRPPVNVLRLTFHPKGLAPSILNLVQWRAHLFERLNHQIEVTADPVLVSLLTDLRNFPTTATSQDEHLQGEHMGVAAPLRIKSPVGVLSFISTTTIFGSPVDVTLQELALETFFPLDDFTMQTLQAMGSALGSP